MNISALITRLETLQEKYGNININFDCPHCGSSHSVKDIEIKLHVKST